MSDRNHHRDHRRRRSRSRSRSRSPPSSHRRDHRDRRGGRHFDDLDRRGGGRDRPPPSSHPEDRRGGDRGRGPPPPSSSSGPYGPPRRSPSQERWNDRGGGGGGPHGPPPRDRREYGRGNDRDRDRDHRRDSGGGRDGRREGDRDRAREPRRDVPPRNLTAPPSDPKISHIADDPRGTNPAKRITHKANARGKGRNTESFDPRSTFVRPELRIKIGHKDWDTYNKTLKHDDVVIVPDLFGKEEDWDLYYRMVEEMNELQQREKEASEEKKDDGNGRGGGGGRGKRGGGGAEWISWHEGAHLISKNPKGCPTYERIVARLCQYFRIDPSKNIGTRFNWYRDSRDWKPFHHDSAAFNPQRAKSQNITVGASFGATRELAFLRAQPYDNGENCKLYFPQVNNGVFSFGRDANILWKHGVNALPEDEQDGKGRISIILWGLAEGVVEEDNSPPLLGADGKGPHASGGDRRRRERNPRWDDRDRRNRGDEDRRHTSNHEHGGRDR